jgi:hypothetical protein
MNRSDDLTALFIGRRIILKWIIYKDDMAVWTE